VTKRKVKVEQEDPREALRRAELEAEGAADQEGTVSAVYAEKGFGWLRGVDGVTRFFHADACDTDLYKLRPGDRLKFKPLQAPKGPRAIEVRVDQDNERREDDRRGNRR
jgi:cold shock CspA family protein